MANSNGRRAVAAPYFDAAHWAQAAADVWSATWLPASVVAQRAQTRLQALLRFARTQVPFYRDLYRDVPRSGPATLAALPVVRKSMLMSDLAASLADRQLTQQQIDAFLAEPTQIGRPIAGRYAIWSSSGSSGEPGVYLHDGDALAVYDALELLRFRGIDLNPLRLGRFVAGERYAMVAAIDGHFAGVSSVQRLRHIMPMLAPFVRAFSVLQPLPALVEALNRYRPTLLAAYPTVAELLAEQQEAGELDLDLAELWCGGECLCDAARLHIERAFGCRVRDAYGASEFMSIAWPCAFNELHLNADWVILEGVDAAGQPVPAGVSSHTTLLTNLANRVQPLIRYDLGDSITVLPQPCRCGSAMPAIKVQGRHDDVLEVATAAGKRVKLMPLALATVLEDDAHVNDFQLLQTGPRSLRLRLGGPARARGEQARAVLRAYLRCNGLERVRIELDRHGPGRSNVSGKLRRIVNALAPDRADVC